MRIPLAFAVFLKHEPYFQSVFYAFSSECEKQLSLIRFEDLENRVAEELKVFACAINKGFQKINKCV